jgi:hypothetical protein
LCIVKPITAEQKEAFKISYAKFYNGIPYGRKVSFAGYGKYETGNASEKLRVFYRWTMVTNTDCRKLSRWSDQITTEQFCAGRIENGKFPGSFGSCHG